MSEGGGVVCEQEPLNMLDQRMMQNVRQATKDADAVLAIVDANDRPEAALPLLQPYLRKGSVPLAVVLNKVVAGISKIQCQYSHDSLIVTLKVITMGLPDHAYKRSGLCRLTC